jgi:hypothetical protein
MKPPLLEFPDYLWVSHGINNKERMIPMPRKYSSTKMRGQQWDKEGNPSSMLDGGGLPYHQIYYL